MANKFSNSDFNSTFWTVFDGDFYVSTTGNDITGTGHPANPFLTVAKAFEEAINGEKIIIGPFEYVAFNEQTGAGGAGAGGAELPCRVATTSNIPLPGGALTVDGILLSVGDRVLVWNQSGPAQNGIYIITSGGWQRDPNFNNSDNVVGGKLIPIAEGNTHAKSVFQLTTTGTINVGSTFLTFEEVAVADWGSIGGTLTNQTDLVTELASKANDSALTAHTTNTSNPHGINKSQIGLGNVNNTSDTSKPVSNPQQTALNLKADVTYVDGQINNLTATIDKATPKGTINASSNPGYPAGDLGDYYYITQAGTLGGNTVEVGDKVQCIADTAAGQSTNWITFQGNLDIAQDADMESRTNPSKYVTPATSYHGWNHWLGNEIVAALNTTNKTIVGAINEAANSGGVVQVGISSNNQIAVWTGNGAIEGSNNLTYDNFGLISSSDIVANDEGGEESNKAVNLSHESDFAAVHFGTGWSLLTYENGFGVADFAIRNNTSGENVIFVEAGNRVTISDSGGGLGAQYAANYASNNTANARWIPDKAYVDAVSGSSSAGALNQLNVANGSGSFNAVNIFYSSANNGGLWFLDAGTHGNGLKIDEFGLYLTPTVGDRTEIVLNANSPRLEFRHQSSSYGGNIRSNALSFDSGSVPMLEIEIFNSNLATKVLTRPLLQITNGSVVETEITADGNWSFEGHLLKNVADPANAQDAATKAYVDANSTGGDVSKVGTPAINQVAVWTGNGTIQGLSKLSFNGNRLIVDGEISQIGIGTDNSAFGNEAFINRTTAFENAAFGFRTMKNTTTGPRNSAFGAESLEANTTGSRNTAVGFGALNNAAGSSSNSALGDIALVALSSGNSNTAIGTSSLSKLTSGSTNIALGHSSGVNFGNSVSNDLTSSDLSIFIGVSSRASANGNTNEIVIGSNAIGNGSNTATWGSTSILDHYFSGNINLNAAKISGLSNPVAATDAATKAYVDANSSGGGNVSKVGVPVDGHLAIWTGDGTLAGEADLYWDSFNRLVHRNNNTNGAGQFVMVPSSGSQSIAMGADMFISGANGPTIWSSLETSSAISLSFIAVPDVGQDSGTNPVMRFVSMRDGNNPIGTRPLFAGYNASTIVWQVAASGNWDFKGNDLTNVGTGTANTNWVIASDERLKSRLDHIPDAMSIVRNLQGHRFERKDLNDGVKRIGFMAQEVNDHLPEVIVNDQDKWFMDYASVSAVHNEAIKSVDNEVVELKEKLRKLESILSNHGITC